jgi:diguanylate cyclase (GGDEF)-like protein
MAWFYLFVIGVVVVYFVQRGGVPPLRWPGDARPVLPPEATPASMEDDPVLVRDRRQLLAAFRSDDVPVSADSEREDRRVIERSLLLLMDQIGAVEAVLWRGNEDDVPRFVPAAWARGPKPPTLTESERLLLELSADEQKSTYKADGTALAFLAVGVILGDQRAAVSVQFREQPTMSRADLTLWVQRHARAIADLYGVVRSRAIVAHRNSKLRSMIRTATTLQGSRDPLALEEALARNACIVTGAQWTIIVRWDSVTRVGIPTHIGERAPEFGVRVTARQGSLVGEVCRTGAAKGFPDARPILASREPVFDDAPLPEGTRSLLIVPLRRSDREAPIGAMVFGHPERGALTSNDGHGANDLGTIAAGALETAWAVQEATERARTDPLTGMPNRRAFDEIFARLMGETDRYGGAMALVMVDIDHFKKVNDTYGHEAGDAVLVAIGQMLMAERRTTDFVARLGGEELALLLPQTDVAGAAELSERLRAKVEAMNVRTAVGEIRITASFGIAMYQARSGASGRVYERADKALYAAKHGGRNRVELERVTPPQSFQVEDDAAP